MYELPRLAVKLNRHNLILNIRDFNADTERENIMMKIIAIPGIDIDTFPILRVLGIIHKQGPVMA